MLAGGKRLSTTGADSGDRGVDVFFKTLFYFNIEFMYSFGVILVIFLNTLEK